jgi:peroxiredoxin
VAPAPAVEAARQPAPAASQASSAAPEATTTQVPPASAATIAELGKPAPDFALRDLNGKQVRLGDQRGKIVVLEWFNPECPFVKASHTKGSLVETAARHVRKGIVWLAINSAAPGKQGHGLEKNQRARENFRLSHPILIDESGAVGRAYQAKTTPHMFVIDKNGVLAYRGAIDNSPDGEGASPTGDRLVNYVDEAIGSLVAGRPLVTRESEPYGCSVKFAK